MRKFAAVMIVLGLGVSACGNETGNAAVQETNETATEESTDLAALPNLDEFLSFAEPESCEFSESFVSAMDTVFEMNADPNAAPIAGPGAVTIPGIAEPVPTQMSRPEPEAPDYIAYQLDFEGSWLGLHVIGYEDAILEESCCVWASAIRFDEPAERVIAALVEAGYSVNADGSRRETVIDEEMTAVTEVREEDGVTRFFCNQVFNY